MPSWTGHPAWGEWSGRLAVATADDFERTALTLLKVLWPDLHQAPRLQGWDKRGVDLLVWADSGPFPCVVQCKGFLVRELDIAHARDVEASIQKFRDSGETADKFLVVHNRVGSDRAFAARIEKQLQGLVDARKVKAAELWDRQRLLTHVFDQMQNLVEEMLRLRSRALSDRLRALFRFADCRVSQVPVSEQVLTLKRGAPPELSELQEPSVRNPTTLIEEASGTNWMVLSGQFGVGKTTAALAAVTGSHRPAIYIACQELSPAVFTGGMTSTLFNHVADEVPILDQVPDEDRVAVSKIARGVMVYLLRKPDSPFLFVLDGLDEHHALARPAGLQRLSNQLAEFACPVVLTTRKEHLDAMLGDFSLALTEIGSKYRSRREARILYLEHWALPQTMQVLEAAIAGTTGTAHVRLRELSGAIADGQQPYGELVFHPLFLQFILEEVSENGIGAASRATLIRRWVERKIRRDRQSWIADPQARRAPVRANLDIEEFIDRICVAMGRVAFEMTVQIEGRCELSEWLPGSRVVEIVSSGLGPVDLVPLLLNSVMTTLGPRRGGAIHIGFALRILHEYFLASELHVRGSEPNEWPATVRELVAEIASDELRESRGV